MKLLLKNLLIVLIAFIAFSCKKTTFIDSPDAMVNFSADTLHYDTVFATAGSVTQLFKILNPNDRKLRLSQIKLMGGATSPFKINVDGTAGATFSDIELEPNDSVYVFVSVTVNPNNANLPFIVQDSILVNYNGNNKYVQLQAFGQNAHFFRAKKITADSTWSNDLPYVILGNLSVDSNVTLSINKGCKIYCHSNAPFIVNGTLKVNGEVYDSTRVIFQGDRLDPGYNDLPAAWPGIFFTASSVNNVLTYAIIKDAYQGIITVSARSANPKIILNQCIINNIYDAGIISVASSIRAANCLISNCGSNIFIAAGGSYLFNYCTAASYANAYIDHKNPVLSVSNADDQNQTLALTAHFQNCIFYGEGGTVENEIVIDKKASADLFDVTFKNILYKNKDNTIDELSANSIKNQAPDFDTIDAGKRYFNFHLKPNSPAVKAGVPTSISIDLDGKRRGALQPDLGCYEQ